MKQVHPKHSNIGQGNQGSVGFGKEKWEGWEETHHSQNPEFVMYFFWKLSTGIPEMSPKNTRSPLDYPKFRPPKSPEIKKKNNRSMVPYATGNLRSLYSGKHSGRSPCVEVMIANGVGDLHLVKSDEVCEFCQRVLTKIRQRFIKILN